MSILYKKNTENTNIFEYNPENKQKTLKQLLAEEDKQFCEYADYYENKNKKFLANKGFRNLSTGESFKINFDITQKHKSDYFYFNQYTSILDKNQTEEGKHSIFYTPTLPTEYHKNKNGKLNPKYNPNLTIKDGYDLLNNHLRGIYKDFKVNNKYIPIKYIVAFERHKDNTVHFHAIFYVDPQYKEKFKEYLKNKNKIDGMGKQYDIKDIQEIAQKTKYKNIKTSTGINPIGYLLKYIKKSINQLDKSWYGWKHYNKIRVFRYSHIPELMPRYVFTRLSRECRENWGENVISKYVGNKKAYNKMEYYNYISNIDYKIKNSYGELLNSYKQKGIKNEIKYNVFIEKERIEKTEYLFKDNDFFIKLSNFNIEKEKSYSKKLISLLEILEQSKNFISEIGLRKEFEEYLFQLPEEVLNVYYYYHTAEEKYLSFNLEGYVEEFYLFMASYLTKKYTYKLTKFDIYDNENNLLYTKPEYEIFLSIDDILE